TDLRTRGAPQPALASRTVHACVIASWHPLSVRRAPRAVLHPCRGSELDRAVTSRTGGHRSMGSGGEPRSPPDRRRGEQPPARTSRRHRGVPAAPRRARALGTVGVTTTHAPRSLARPTTGATVSAQSPGPGQDALTPWPRPATLGC